VSRSLSLKHRAGRESFWETKGRELYASGQPLPRLIGKASGKSNAFRRGWHRARMEAQKGNKK